MLYQEACCVAYFCCLYSFFCYLFSIHCRHSWEVWRDQALSCNILAFICTQSWLCTNYAIFKNICNDTFSVTYNIVCNRTMSLTRIMYGVILYYYSNSSRYLILRTFGSRGPLCMLSFDRYQYAVCSLCWICMKIILWTYANLWPNQTESTTEEQEQIDAQELTRQIKVALKCYTEDLVGTTQVKQT